MYQLLDKDSNINITKNSTRGVHSIYKGLLNTAAWFLETWRAYVKTKYRAALNRWDTDTGNEAHDAHEFGKLFAGNTQWLTWVYVYICWISRQIIFCGVWQKEDHRHLLGGSQDLRIHLSNLH